MNAAELIETGGWGGAIVALILALVSGGAVKALIDARVSSKLGVKGNAIAQGNSAIDGYSKLMQSYESMIKTQDKRIADAEQKFDDAKAEFTSEIKRFDTEMAAMRSEVKIQIHYQDILIAKLEENTIEIPPRPQRS